MPKKKGGGGGGGGGGGAGKRAFTAADSPEGRALAKLHQGALRQRSEWDEPLVAADLVPEQPAFLLLVDDFLSASECKALIAAANAAGLAESPLSDQRPKKGEAFLFRESVAFVEPAVTAELWARLRPLLPDIERGTSGAVAEPLGFHGDGRGRGGAGKEGVSGQLKYYRYQKGHSFGQHVDQSWKGASAGDETEYTLLVYLNSQGEVAPTDGSGLPLCGGETVFHRSAKAVLAEVVPKAGAALLHAHGRRCLMHEGAEVTKGVKYLLRADVMYRLKSEEKEETQV